MENDKWFADGAAVYILGDAEGWIRGKRVQGNRYYFVVGSQKGVDGSSPEGAKRLAAKIAALLNAADMEI